ncbi:MAG: DUF997 family protein [Rhodothermales bacterium]
MKTLSKTFLNARREAWLILLAWFVCLIWTVGYSAYAGYGTDGTTLTLVAGMPAWIVWGVLLPWFSATVFSVLFALFYMADDSLGDDVLADVSDNAPGEV